MKIIREDCAYIQFEDINYLLGKDVTIPIALQDRIEKMNLDLINSTNKYYFMRFDEPEIIDYIGSMGKCLVDFDEVYNLSEQNLVKWLNDLDELKDSLLEKMVASNNTKKTKYYLDAVNDILYKYYQIDTFLDYKRGYNDKIKFPDGIPAPKKKNKLNIFSLFKEKIGKK